MAKIILNDEEFAFSGYSRTTYFNADETISSSGYIGDLRGNNLATRISALAQEPITFLSIEKDDGTEIYTLNNINAKINSMDESYNGTDMIMTNLNLQFNQ